MILHSSIISRLKGLVTPEDEDQVIRLPPVAVVPFPLRLPCQALDAAPTTPVDFSYSFNGSTFVAASTAAGSLSLGFLAPGLWELFLQYWVGIDFSPGPAAVPNLGIGMIKSPAVLLNRLCMGAYQNVTTYHQQIPSKAKVVISLDANVEISAVTPATGVGQTATVQAFMIASRLH